MSPFLLFYLELNPVRARLADSPEAWPWSSAASHVTGKGDVLAESAWLHERTAGWVCSWRQYLLGQDSQADHVGQELRQHEKTGRPLGQKHFVEKLELTLNRRLLPRKRGPKPKKKKARARLGV